MPPEFSPGTSFQQATPLKPHARKPGFLRLAATGVGLLLLAASACAEVVSASEGGFEVLEKASIAAAPKDVYARVVNIGTWWNSAHTYSGDAANMSLDLRPGGCFCEKLKDGGGVQHLVVVNFVPDKVLRLAGGLGPLQGLGVAGSMTILLAPTATGTDLTLRYRVGGYSAEGLKQLSAPVDQVLGEQVARLKRVTETGKAE